MDQFPVTVDGNVVESTGRFPDKTVRDSGIPHLHGFTEIVKGTLKRERQASVAFGQKPLVNQTQILIRVYLSKVGDILYVIAVEEASENSTTTISPSSLFRVVVFYQLFVEFHFS